MGISWFKIKKWTNMLRGKSIYHVCQDQGKIYSKAEVRGYYNNLTEKVTRFGLEDDTVPQIQVDTGETIYFSIAIFQYGLAAYDLYLMNQDETMMGKVLACADWAVENQGANGGWLTFAHETPEHPYSSMAQGEGISLLLRAYLATKDEKYFEAASRAKTFMLLPIEEGGVTRYAGEDVYFYEFTNTPLVLNGWIFSLWGIYDYAKATDDGEARRVFAATVASLKKKLPEYDTGYWSRYDEKKRISSPFYHSLHIAQLRVMYELTGEELFTQYAERWERYQKSFWKSKRAFVKKAWQKIME